MRAFQPLQGEKLSTIAAQFCDTLYIERVAEFMGLYFRGLRLSW
jgi:hypothetical protein